jgi:DNA-binding transcriptional MocR family regulator
MPLDQHASLIDLSINLPPEPGDLDVGAELAAAFAALSRRRDVDALLQYQPQAGSPRHREAGAEWIRRSGLETSADRVLVCCGAQHAMAVLFGTLAQPGDTVLTEEATYPGMKALAAMLGLRLHGVAMDGEGIVPDALDAAARARGARLLYCVPSIQNPTAATMSEARRAAIARVAAAHDITIVEDDIHGSLAGHAARPIACFAPERTYYVADTSKSVLPSLRVSFLHALPGTIDRLALGIQATTWMASPITAEIATTWIEDGTAERIVAARRREAAARQAIAADALRGVPYQAHPTGYHLWIPLPESLPREPFVAQARARGVAVTSAEAFAVGRGATPHAIRACLGAVRSRADLERGLGVLAELIRSPAQAYRSIV